MKISVAKAVQLLEAGKLVAIPTETVYGLAADATNGEAVAKIFATKQRPHFNPLIMHVHNVKQAEKFVEFNEKAYELAAAFWPGPLTMVLEERSDSTIAKITSSGLPTLAIRIPNHKIALSILKKFANPIAAPSANPSERLSPTTSSHVEEYFNGQIPVVDGGATDIGIESTIVDLTVAEPILLRPGQITREQIEEIIGPISTIKPGKINSPGQLLRHYAPTKPITLNCTKVEGNVGLLAFGSDEIPGAVVTLNLSKKGDLCEAAANLFAMLHQMDACEIDSIAVMPIPNAGIGVAINDRLARAAGVSS